MEIKTNKELESSGYRCLFECTEQEGIEPVIQFINDSHNFVDKTNVIFKNAILYGHHDSLSLTRKNLDIVKFIREHINDFKSFNFAGQNVLDTFSKISEDPKVLKLYLENARILEELKVDLISFSDFKLYNTYDCDIYRDSQGEITYINKYYTDGKIIILGEEIEKDKFLNASEINFTVEDNTMSFLLNALNTERGYSFRNIKVRDFGFDGSKLPSEEELRSYEIPKSLIKK